jgi:hypothetical protein
VIETGAIYKTWAEGLAGGKLNDQDELPFLQLLLIANEADSKSYGAGPPRVSARSLRSQPRSPACAATGRSAAPRALAPLFLSLLAALEHEPTQEAADLLAQRAPLAVVELPCADPRP